MKDKMREMIGLRGAAASPAGASRSPATTAVLHAAGQAVVQLLRGRLPDRTAPYYLEHEEPPSPVALAVDLDTPLRCATCRSADAAAADLQVPLAGPLTVLLALLSAGLPVDPAFLEGEQVPPGRRAGGEAPNRWALQVLLRETAEELRQCWPVVLAVARALAGTGQLSGLELLEVAVPAFLTRGEALPEALLLLLRCGAEEARTTGGEGERWARLAELGVTDGPPGPSREVAEAAVGRMLAQLHAAGTAGAP